MTKGIITRKLILYQLIAYGVLLLLIVGDEVLDLPHTLFGSPATPINWSESLMEGGYVIALAVLSVFFSRRLMMQVRYMEGLLPICSFCKRIRLEGDWRPIEEYVRTHSAAEFTHGLCPECLEKNYGTMIKGGSGDRRKTR